MVTRGTFRRSQKVALVGTVDEAGWPYVIPLIYVYEGDERLYLHTGGHHRHFVRNVQHNPRICVEVGEMGAVHRGQPFACNSALVFTSVIVFGPFRILDDRAKKSWFFDRILEKYASRIGRSSRDTHCSIGIVLYEQQMEIVTGKHSEGLHH
jgi:nitroimidazol reductase NimA-like FMN-containing flavoprotein (pyridoxamine 5'-phosphate oxidase superfamily)